MKSFLAATFVLGAIGGAALAESRPGDGDERRTPTEMSVTYSGCNQVRDLGLRPLRAGQPGYREWMDGDLDGLACEPRPGDADYRGNARTSGRRSR